MCWDGRLSCGSVDSSSSRNTTHKVRQQHEPQDVSPSSAILWAVLSEIDDDPPPEKAHSRAGDPQQPLCVLKEQTIPIVLPGHRIRMPLPRGGREIRRLRPIRHDVPIISAGIDGFNRLFGLCEKEPPPAKPGGSPPFRQPPGITVLPEEGRPEPGDSFGPDRFPCSRRPPWAGSPTPALR